MSFSPTQFLTQRIRTCTFAGPSRRLPISSSRVIQSANQAQQPFTTDHLPVIRSSRYSSIICGAVPNVSKNRRYLSTTVSRFENDSFKSEPSTNSPLISTEKKGEDNLIGAPKGESQSQVIGQIEPRLQMTFTCTANDCGHRSTHEFARRSYEKGIVIVQCPSCKNRHLIADHLGWFKESTKAGSLRTVEDLVRAKGEKVRRGRVGSDGDIEYFE